MLGEKKSILFVPLRLSFAAAKKYTTTVKRAAAAAEEEEEEDADGDDASIVRREIPGGKTEDYRHHDYCY